MAKRRKLMQTCLSCKTSIGDLEYSGCYRFFCAVCCLLAAGTVNCVYHSGDANLSQHRNNRTNVSEPNNSRYVLMPSECSSLAVRHEPWDILMTSAPANPQPACCVACQGVRSASNSCKNKTCSMACCQSMPSGSTGSSCKYHTGQQDKDCVNCSGTLSAKAKNKCANGACKAACCKKVGPPCAYHCVSGEVKPRTCTFLRLPLPLHPSPGSPSFFYF